MFSFYYFYYCIINGYFRTKNLSKISIFPLDSLHNQSYDLSNRTLLWPRLFSRSMERPEPFDVTMT